MRKGTMRICVLMLMAAFTITFAACGGGGGSTVSTGAAPLAANLSKTGQTVCYDAAGAVTVCTNSGQDGDLQKGVAWPSPRFTDNGDQTVTDNLTGLMWTKDGKSPGPDYCSGGVWQQWDYSFNVYLSCINAIPYLGHNDWRLPNVYELESLANASQSNAATWLNAQGFRNVEDANYWSSTTSSADTGRAYGVNLLSGYISANSKGNSAYIWLVRAGQNTAPANLPKTGQTVCYNASGTVISCTNTGQDGELQNGAAWPSPRFSDNGNQTITDNLTGLIWTKDGNAPGPAGCNPGATKNWIGALTYVSCLNTNNYLGHNDWRLPNKKELSSLYSYGHPDTASWLITQGFTNVQDYWYWSSTTLAWSTAAAWIVDMSNNFGVYYDNKTDNIYVWPVRAGH